jgi:uncharacterized repeat protein (TIGR04138 family)
MMSTAVFMGRKKRGLVLLASLVVGGVSMSIVSTDFFPLSFPCLIRHCPALRFDPYSGMLCEHCKKREARVFSTSIFQGQSSTLSVCVRCFKTHYPEQFAQMQAIHEAGCSCCGKKCGASMCGSCVEEMRRMMEAKGVSEPPDESAMEEELRNYREGLMEVEEHMRRRSPERKPWPDEADESFADLFAADALFEQLAQADTRFTVEAYEFVVCALNRAAPVGGEHVSGRDLALAFRDLALEAFGQEALKILIEWGVYTTDDIGTIVYQLIEAGRFGKRPEDRIEDFHAVYDFAEAFSAE